MKWRVAIIGLLVGLIGLSAFPFFGVPPHSYSKVKVAQVTLDMLGSALTIYQLDIGDYPSVKNGLRSLVEKPNDADVWYGPYLNKPRVPLDPWGHEYIYQRFDNGCLIVSFGTDGKAGGSGDDADIQVEIPFK